MQLSKKHAGLADSVTLAINAMAKQMKLDGANIISFGVGEPDFDTPDNIRKSAKKAINEGHTRYTAASGMLELREVICKKLEDDNQLYYSPENIVVSNGAKHSLYNALQAICNPGDEIIVPIPYWVSYPEMIKMADAVPVFIECSEKNEFKLEIDELIKAITPKTKALLLNSPSNPTGSIYSKHELEAIARVAINHNILIISDEIYEKLVYDDAKHISIAALNDEIKELTIVVNGMSKAYAMTGWRIGYTASNKKIAKIISKIQSHSTSNPNTIAQYASVEGIKNSDTSIESMRLSFDERRKYMVKRINEMKDLSCIVPKGAFYVMLNISKFIGKVVAGKTINNSLDFAQIVISKANVAVVPGSAFGADKFARLSYANSIENIKEGLDRIESFLSE
ncbi:MAG: pyridoxal phosphate-dependent aminotransferase [Clostridiales bacterium]|nr:pyridoxal phosphate-dependent aminotransferase [Clostridiales bacterium]